MSPACPRRAACPHCIQLSITPQSISHAPRSVSPNGHVSPDRPQGAGCPQRHPTEQHSKAHLDTPNCVPNSHTSHGLHTVPPPPSQGVGTPKADTAPAPRELRTHSNIPLGQRTPQWAHPPCHAPTEPRHAYPFPPTPTPTRATATFPSPRVPSPRSHSHPCPPPRVPVPRPCLLPHEPTGHAAAAPSLRGSGVSARSQRALGGGTAGDRLCHAAPCHAARSRAEPSLGRMKDERGDGDGTALGWD